MLSLLVFEQTDCLCCGLDSTMGNFERDGYLGTHDWAGPNSPSLTILFFLFFLLVSITTTMNANMSEMFIPRVVNISGGERARRRVPWPHQPASYDEGSNYMNGKRDGRVQVNSEGKERARRRTREREVGIMREKSEREEKTWSKENGMDSFFFFFLVEKLL